MTDNRPDTFEEWLDVVLSRFIEERGAEDLAEQLYAAANGLLAAQQPRPRWNDEERVVEVPYLRAEDLEASLEDFLSLKAICVDVPDVPMMQELTMRVLAASQHVDIPVRSVQNTAAGVVFQVMIRDVETQRALVGLPGALRMNPPRESSVNRSAVRQPNMSSRAEATQHLEPPSPVVAPPVTAEPYPSLEESSVVDIEPAEPKRTFEGPRTRHTLKFSLLEVTEGRMHHASYFEVLGVHFSADEQEVEEARDKLIDAVEFVRDNEVDPALHARAERVRERVLEVARELADIDKRRAHRSKVVSDYEVETAVTMYEKQGETAKMRGHIDAAIEAYRRLTELCPDKPDFAVQLAALRQLVLSS